MKKKQRHKRRDAIRGSLRGLFPEKRRACATLVRPASRGLVHVLEVLDSRASTVRFRYTLRTIDTCSEEPRGTRCDSCDGWKVQSLDSGLTEGRPALDEAALRGAASLRDDELRPEFLRQMQALRGATGTASNDRLIGLVTCAEFESGVETWRRAF